MKTHKQLTLIIFFVISLFLSCEKGDDFIDSTSNFPIGWKSSDSFDLIIYNVKDTISSILNTGIAPIGTVIDGNFGVTRTSFYASYQTTLSSKTFSFSSVDSILLILPYYYTLPKYGPANNPFSIEVYEMIEGFDTISNSKKNSFLYNGTPLGSITNFMPNVNDSVIDGTTKISPSIRIPLSASFANKLIAPGTYADDVAFQAVLKGLYIRSSSNSSTNGFLLLSLSSGNKIKIYGKNSSGESITSEFTTGGSNTTTVNEYLHDNSSLAYSASQSANTTSGDNILYNGGLGGYYNKLILPDFNTLAINKNIFKVELSFYSIDTGYLASTSLGMLFVDSATGKEYTLPDEYYHQNYLMSVKDTTIGAYKCKEYKYNIGYLANKIINHTFRTNMINVYSAPLSIGSSSTTKFSSFFPSRIVMGGTGNLARPRLKIFYTDK